MIKPIMESWDEFWFKPSEATSITRTRVALALVAAVWFASFLAKSSYWFGEEGVLNLATSSQLLGFAQVSRVLNWSPLWLTDSLLLMRLWLILGVLASVLVLSGFGGRIGVVVWLVLAVGWAHRIFWLSSPAEPALVALMAYLLIAPGSTVRDASPPKQSGAYTLVRRLIQVHVWVLLMAGLLSALASFTWWRGEGIWWLASAGRSNLLTQESLSNARVVNFLSHATLVGYGLTLWWLVVPATRQIGIFVGWACCAGIALLADQVLYAAVLAAGLTAFWPTKPVRENPSQK